MDWIETDKQVSHGRRYSGQLRYRPMWGEPNILQQAVEVIEYIDGEPVDKWLEWEDVPTDPDA